MKPLASMALTVLLASAAAAQPERDKLYSTPSLPPGDVLRRLNLKEAWSAAVPTRGRRDGILSFQILPLRKGKDVSYQLLIQTRSGRVVLMNAETGQTLWRTQVGDRYKGTYAAGYNSRGIYVERSSRFYGLSRRTGEILWQMNLSAGATAAPLADAHFLFLCLNAGEVAYYDLPSKGEKVPTYFRSFRSPVQLQMEPALTNKYLVYPSPTGSVTILTRDAPGQLVRYRTESTLLAPPGVHEVDEAVYIGSRDTNVYGHTFLGGELPWRHTCGAPVYRSPFVNDGDVYAVGDGTGLFRLRRLTLTGPELVAYLGRLGAVGQVPLQAVTKALGPRAQDASAVISLLEQKGYLSVRQKRQLAWRGGDEVWRNREGDRVHAVNPKFVYATDSSGRLLVLDRVRGRRLSRYDFRDFVLPVSNEFTDRLYLAANSGLVVCLHDRDYPTPLTMKKVPTPDAVAPVPVKKGGGGKPKPPAEGEGGKPKPPAEGDGGKPKPPDGGMPGKAAPG